MLTKTKAKSALKMLITLFLTLALILGIYFAIPKQSTKVSAATTGSSATLLGYTSVTHGIASGSIWYNKLIGSISQKNITSITITTNISKIAGFNDSGIDVSDGTTGYALNYYYKSAGYQVDTDGDGVVDTDGYDIVIYADVEKIYAPVCSGWLFLGFVNCESIEFENFSTIKATNMVKMFDECKKLTKLDLSCFDTSNVTDMCEMFFWCESLQNITFGNNFSTSQVIDMNMMFAACLSLKSLDVSNFDTSNVTDMSGMFAGINSLTVLNLSEFDFGKISNESQVDMILGYSYEEFAQLVDGLDVEAFLQASFDEKVNMIVEATNGDMSAEDVREEMSVTCSKIPKIIAPADLNGLEISLPSKYNVDGEEDPVTTLQEGKTHTLAGASTDTSETGIISDNILLSLIALCFVFSGFMMLKKKKVR